MCPGRCAALHEIGGEGRPMSGQKFENVEDVWKKGQKSGVSTVLYRRVKRAGVMTEVSGR